MTQTDRSGLEIAVIGMAGRFPGARTVEALWGNLCRGVERIATFTDDEMIAAGVDPALLRHPHYVKAGGVLDDVEWFDAAFFGYNAREASIMDPQHRVFLECAWEALESAGCDPSRYRGAIGVYAGASMNAYAWSNLLYNRAAVEAAGEFQTAIANLNDHLATRVSYKLDLHGSSFTVQTACSTSLVAVHLACQSLLSGESDAAIAGGVSIGLPQRTGYLYREGGVHSRDGHCRAFDARADGMVGGHGVGAVVLKRLDDAIADGDRVWAIVRGSAVNNDGAAKVGYTAPSVDGQSRVIAAAQLVAGVAPATIGYVETHGTGTPLGDPVEVEALKRVFGKSTARRASCAIGSIKTNVGHLDAAAGVTSFIKAVLAVDSGRLPASLNFETPNPELGLDDSPFFVNARLSDWPGRDTPRRAGVSSFGIGGTNAHVVLEQAPPAPPTGPSRDHQVIVLSARSDAALDEAVRNLANRLQDDPALPLADVAFTLQQGRRQFPSRACVVCRDTADAVAALSSTPPRLAARTSGIAGRARVAFMLPGQGAQHAGMGRDLYQQEPVFREVIDRSAAVLQPVLGIDLKDLLFDRTDPETAEARLRDTRHAQPAIFAVDYAIARLWMSWGIMPGALIGHSLGEYVAACLADVFTLEDGLRLVAARGRLMQATAPGAMIAVAMGEAALQPWLGADVSLAAINARESLVVSGPLASIDRIEQTLSARGVGVTRLRTSHAFHSATMDGVLDAFAAEVSRCTLNAPRIPCVSNLTGTWLTASEACDPQYWVRHLREPVRFAAGLADVVRDGITTLLEVGPGRTLSAIAAQMEGSPRPVTALSSLPHPGERAVPQAHLLTTLGRLWCAGVAVDWRAFSANERRRRVALPTYPFERLRYWIDPVDKAGAAADPGGRTRPAFGNLVPVWRRRALAPPPVAAASAAPSAEPSRAVRTWLLLADSGHLTTRLDEGLRGAGDRVVVVTAGDRCAIDPDRLTIRPGVAGDHLALVRHLRDTRQLPDVVVHAWSLGGERRQKDDLDAAEQPTGFSSLLHLIQAFGREAVFAAMRLEVVSTGIFDVTGVERLLPEHALLIGPATVAPQEYPHILARVIDVEDPGTADGRLAAQLLAEFAVDLDDAVVALRGAHRWVRSFEPLFDAAPGSTPRLRDDGVYLITGGLGRIGLTCAEAIASRVRARLVLMGRTVPGQGTGAAADAADRARIDRLDAEVVVATGDVGDSAALRGVVDAAVARWGRIDGVIHAAGIAGEQAMRAIAETDASHCAAQFAAKVHGVDALADALRGRSIDFCVLTSSISTVLGGLGFCTYAAANASMDTFAWRESRRTGVPWISVNFDGWAPVGAAEPGHGIDAARGSAALARVLALDVGPQVVVANDDLTARMREWINPGRAREGRAAAEAARHPRPELSRAYVPPRTDIERAVAGIWGELLGIDGVGAEDDFFELGGHSLLATQLLSRLRSRFAVDLPLRSLFEATTVAAMAERLAAPGDVGGRTGTQGTQTEGTETERGETESIVPAAAGPAVLSSGQRRLWFLDRLDPASGAYHIPAALRVSGALDVGVLERCLGAMADRHRILRARFVDVDGVPMQVPGGEPPALMTRDLAALTPVERQGIIDRLIREETSRPFDLREGPVLRAMVLRLGDADHVVILTMHHIASDGWSMAVFVKELGALYEAFVKGRPSPLPDLPIQYADFARWQQAWLRTPDMQRQLDYWTRQLDGVVPVPLSTDLPRPAVATLRGAVDHTVLDPALAARLRAFSRDHHATPFMALIAAFEVLIFRYTGQADISVGSPIANRNRPEIEGLIGFFVNTLVLRTSLAGDPGFRDVVARVREMALEAYAHQDLPFEELVDAIGPGRSLSRNPLFQVMFVLQNTPQERLEVAGATFAPIDVETTTAKFDLSMYVVDEPAGMTVLLEYNRDLFLPETIRRMLGHFERIVRAAIDEPDRAVAELPMLSEAERRHVVEERNATRTPFPREATIHALFAGQAAAHAGRVAVVAGDVEVTYGELDRRADRLADRLTRAGVGPDVLVALCVERSVEMVVGLLGILKAGGAYVPIDPGLPDDRIGLMLRDAGVDLVLAHAPTIGRFAGRALRVVDLGQEEADEAVATVPGPAVFAARPAGLAARPAASPARTAASALNLAYVMYTSGSTGQPKGVSVPHQAVVRLVRDTNYVRLTPDDVLLQLAPLSFDASTFEIWGALLNGARLVMHPADNPSLGELAATLDRHGVTTVWLTAGLFHQMVDAHPDTLARRRQVIAGGDVLSAARVRELLALSGCTVINGFGPTENTTFTCCHPMTDAAAVGDAVSIGRPIANTTVYVLDERLEPVPVGVCGELYAGGYGLARGYLGEPGLTAQRFLPDPFDAEPGARMYRTGDYARLCADGTIAFLGRRDHQVKLRGFRIELGEVEAAMRQHPDVQDAVVTIREDRPGDRLLVGYAAPRDQAAIDTQALRRFLAGRLPEYMVPSRIVPLTALPLTLNGKVDRAALPRPDAEADRSGAFVEPSSPEEAAIASMWADLLGVARVGATDNFFELGGHSLLATQVASRVRETFGVELPLRSLFLEPTVAGVARELSRLRAEGAMVEPVAIVARPRMAGQVARSPASAGPIPSARRLK